MKFLTGFLQYKGWENTTDNTAVQLLPLNAATHTELYIKVLTIIHSKDDMLTIKVFNQDCLIAEKILSSVSQNGISHLISARS